MTDQSNENKAKLANPSKFWIKKQNFTTKTNIRCIHVTKHNKLIKIFDQKT